MYQTTTEATAAAERGAALLDSKRPGWEREIDLGILDLASLDSCVLGQLYGVWSVGTREVGVEWDTDAQGAYGFDNTGEIEDVEYDDLTAAWVNVILDRRGIEVLA